MDARVKAKLSYDTTTQRVVLLDVSREGMKIEAPDTVEVGTNVVISLLGTDITASVQWSHSGMVGLELLQNLDRNTMIALDHAQKKLQKARQGAPSS